jgi:hypothetical protein
MVVLVLDAAAQQAVSFQLEPFAVAVLRTHLDGNGAGHSAVVPREGQAALVGGLFLLRNSKDLGVDKINELVLVILGNLLRGIGGVPHHEQAAHHTHLRASQTHAVGGDHGLAHIVQQSSQTVVKIGHRAADLVQDGVAFFNNITDSHNGTSSFIRCHRPSAGLPRPMPWTAVFLFHTVPVQHARGRGSGGHCGT